MRETLVHPALEVAAFLGLPVASRDGHLLGALCVIDTQPRAWTPAQIETLRELAASVVTEIELRVEITDSARVVEECKQQARELRRNTEDARFQGRLLEQAGQAVIGLDLDRRIIHWNKAAEQLYGWTAAEAMGQKAAMLELVPEESRAHAAAIARQLELGESWSGEFLIQRKDRHRLPVYATNAPIYDADRQLTGFIGISTDISERKATEAALRESERHHRRLLDTAQEAIVQFGADGRLRYVNDRLCTLLGYSEDEMLGTSLYQFVHPDDHAAIKAGFERRRQGQRDSYEAQMRHKDGATVHVRISASPITDANGDFAGVLSMLTDLTDVKRAVEALRESESRFRTICEVAPMGIFLADAGGNTTYLNAGKLEQLGLAAEQALGTGWTRAVHPEDRERLFATWTRCAQSAEPFESTHRFVHADGSVVWCEVRILPLREGENTLGYVGASLDITRRKEAEAALEQHRELLQTILDHIPVMIAVLDEQSRIFFTNREWERILGWTLEDARALDVGAQLYPDDYQRVQELIQRAESTWCDFKTHVRDGSILDTAWAHIRLSNGQCIAIGQDITERKRSEERTQAFQGLGQLLNEARTPEEAARVVIDVADKLLGWDACWLELVSPLDGTSRTVVIMDEVDGKRSEVPVPFASASSMAVRAINQGGYAILRKPEHLPDPKKNELGTFGDTSRVSASLLCVPIRAHDRAVGALSIQSYRFFAYSEADLKVLQALADYCAGALERTEAEAARELLQQQLVQAHKMEAVGRLAGGVAHDFNNMLAVINGYSELLLRDGELGSSMEQGLREIHRAGERAADLTRQLLAFSRKQLREMKVLDLNEIVQNTQRMLQRLIGEDVELAIRLNPALGLIEADPSQIDQILINLSVNARDAMPRGGRLTIETRNVELNAADAHAHTEVAPGSYVLLSVSDTGCGMSSEVVARIWEPFFTTKGVGEGTGLGLATIYGIVKQSGGYVTVESQLGSGSTFRVYLPRYHGESGIHQEQSPATLTGSETVLVVEDEAMVRGLVRNILTASGYEVLEARNGVEAISISERFREPIHLLLTDVVMPGGMSGSVLAQRLSAQRPSMKVLFMSGYTDDSVLRQGIEHEGAAFIQKPFVPAALTQKLRELLGTA